MIIMPNPYAIDLHWRIVWAHLTQAMTALQISELFCVSKRTVRRYVKIFSTTGNIEPARRRHGPEHLLGDFEQLTLLTIILDHPGIYLFDIQGELEKVGVQISVPTICRTLKLMGCSRQVRHHVALQRSDAARARFMSEISVYDSDVMEMIKAVGIRRKLLVKLKILKHENETISTCAVDNLLVRSRLLAYNYRAEGRGRGGRKCDAFAYSNSIFFCGGPGAQFW